MSSSSSSGHGAPQNHKGAPLSESAKEDDSWSWWLWVIVAIVIILIIVALAAMYMRRGSSVDEKKVDEPSCDDPKPCADESGSKSSCFAPSWGGDVSRMATSRVPQPVGAPPS